MSAFKKIAAGLVACVSVIAATATVNDRAIATPASSAAVNELELRHPSRRLNAADVAEFLSSRRAPVRPMPLYSERFSSTCYQYNAPDPVGDTTGGIDAKSLSLGYNCIDGIWVAKVVTASPIVGHNASLILDMETDGDNTNNCGGFDHAAIVTWAPAWNLLAVDTVMETYSGGSCHATSVASGFATLTATTIEIPLSEYDVPNINAYYVLMTAVNNPTLPQIDSVPDGLAVLRAQRSGSSAFTDMGPEYINRVYSRGVPGDFNGDGRGDIYWYSPGPLRDNLAMSKYGGYSFDVIPGPVLTATYVLRSGDFDNDGYDDLFALGPGTTNDLIYYGSSTGAFTKVLLNPINGAYIPAVGDFNGDGFSDILFYKPGTGSEYLWSGGAGRTFAKQPMPPINGTYKLVVGNYDGADGDDLFFYTPGVGTDYLWRGQAGGSGVFLKGTKAVNGVYAMQGSGDFNCDGLDDMLLYNPNTATDAVVLGRASAPYLLAIVPTVINEIYAQMPIADYSGDGCDDVMFYGKGLSADLKWFGK